MGSLEHRLDDSRVQAEAIHAYDWTDTPLGPRSVWSAALTAVYEMMMASPLAMCAGWGSELTLIYNGAYADFLAARHPAALGQPIARVWHDVWPDISPLIERAMAGGQVHHTDMHLVMTRKGHPEDTYWTFAYSPLRDGSGVVGFLDIAIETTAGVLAGRQRDEAHRRLNLRNEDLENAAATNTVSLQLFESIVQSDEAPILAFDHGYRVLAFNQAHDDDFQRVMGRRQQLGDVLPDLFPAEQAAALRGLMDRALAGERFVIIQEFGDPGREVPTWEITYTPIYGGDGRVAGAFHHARNISERVRAEAELVATQEALRQSQKMEAVGQLTGGVAHDFNNLLTIIRSSVDLLRKPDLPDERRRRYMDAVSDTVERAAKLTGQLLAFARRQALKPETFEVGACLRGVADMLDTVTGSRIRVGLELPEAPCHVRCDRSQFETALINMAVNARDAMDGEGALTLRLACGRPMPEIRGHAGSRSAFAAVSLIDTGTGIAPADLARIFEPFFTTKEVGKGTGLGLSQVFGFAKQSGGDLDVVSALGTGTTFTLYLPEVEAPDERPSDGTPEAGVVDGAGRRVLVVEDNVEVGRFATQILQDLGYMTEWAANAEAALERLDGDGAGFDVVFSDVVMPGMGGIALAEALRRRLPDLPVVLASGYSHVLAEEGAHGFELLHKPYSADQLSHVLRRAIARAA
ncbi:PAS domain-containing protein [Methylobacterium guangdongense]|uniref:PAS domain-containing protein n=1 Tax=Methylobacterium guangdongense TaxID=3138811 RepID=UPI00399CF52B